MFNDSIPLVASQTQLKELVDFVQHNKSTIIFGAVSVYAAFIQNEALSKTISEIEGSRDVAIKVNFH